MSLPLAHINSPIEAIQPLVASLAAFGYARRARTLSHRAAPVPGWRQGCFYGGLVLILVALYSPIGIYSDELLGSHMVEHLLIGDIATLLIVIGLTGPLIAPVMRLRFFDRLRVLSNPLIALPLWAADLYMWHLPAFYEAALRTPIVHGLEHVMFIALGINMWMPLLGPLPQPKWFGNLGKLIYIIAVRLSGALLGNVFVWSSSILYPYYSRGEHHMHVSALQDQGFAGAAMMIEGSLLTIALFAWLFLKAAREGVERQELIELADARGVALSDDRAGRAVASGRGAALRERIES